MSQVVYKTSRAILRCLFRLGGGLTVSGQEHVPPAESGGVIVAANHCSHLDPMILGAAFERPLHFMARRTLFDVPLFATLIRWNNAFPLDRDGDSRDALRAMGERLAGGHAVVMFPEGTRSPDGAIGAIKPGIGMLAVRNATPVVPVYIWGSYAAWPRGRRFPRPGRLKVLVAPAIVPSRDSAVRKDEQRRVTQEVETALGAMEKEAWAGETGAPAALLERWKDETGSK